MVNDIFQSDLWEAFRIVCFCVFALWGWWKSIITNKENNRLRAEGTKRVLRILELEREIQSMKTERDYYRKKLEEYESVFGEIQQAEDTD